MEVLIWPVVLLFFGLGLLVAEVFLPAGGLIGLLAAGCLVASFSVAYSSSVSMGLRWGVVEGIMVPATWFGAMFGLPRTKLGRRIYLRPPTGDDLEEPGSRILSLDQIGSCGRALTPLRPSGMIDFEGRRVEGMAESGLIRAGASVTVVAVRSGRIVVRED